MSKRRPKQLRYSGPEYRHLQARDKQAPRVNVLQAILNVLTQRERENHLPWLTMQEAARLFDNWRKGDFAKIQMTWDELEMRDEDLFAGLNARQSALAELPWRVVTDAEAVGDDPTKQELADRQAAWLTQRLNAVDNLDEALVHLGMADFRGYAALEISGNADHQRWEVIEPWLISRPVRTGPWLYNADADEAPTMLEEFDMRRIIITEAPPIDMPVMFLICAKYHSTAGWDAFIDTFGNPSIFFELPPNCTQERANEYDAIVRNLIAEGRGTLESGTKIQTVETQQQHGDIYEGRAKWCKEAIITLCLGGTLTMTSAPDSGTLAGNAHADSKAELIAATARRISRAVMSQYVRPALVEAFPDEDILVRFTIEPEEEEDRAAQAQMLATLASAGYRVTDEEASQIMGMEVSSANMDSTSTYATKAAGYVPTLPAMETRIGMDLIPDPNAASALDNTGNGAVANSASAPTTGEPPLTPDELAAIKALTAPRTPQEMTDETDALTDMVAARAAQHAAEEQDALRGPKNAEESSEPQLPATDA